MSTWHVHLFGQLWPGKPHLRMKHHLYRWLKSEELPNYHLPKPRKRWEEINTYCIHPASFWGAKYLKHCRIHENNFLVSGCGFLHVRANHLETLTSTQPTETRISNRSSLFRFQLMNAAKHYMDYSNSKGFLCFTPWTSTPVLRGEALAMQIG